MSYSMPRDVLFGPVSIQGFGAIHPWHRQEFYHLIDFVNETTNRTLTGSLPKATCEELRIEIGSNLPLQDLDFSIFGHLASDTLIKTIWRYCFLYDIGIPASPSFIPLMRENDLMIMEEMGQAGIKGQELYQVNMCRLWLKAFTISDIAMFYGRMISQDA